MVRITGLILFCMAGSLCAQRIEPVNNFDLNRYLGKWHEIARMPNSFEKNLINVTATYSLRDDGKVKVLNEGDRQFDGKHKSAKGVAKFKGDPTVGHLRVSFFRPFYADYIVAELDTAYQWVMVTGSKPKLLWILSREPTLDPAIFDRLVEKAKSLGYDTSRLLRIPQNR
jgi:apolipoprotein D and lipocalin family protein